MEKAGEEGGKREERDGSERGKERVWIFQWELGSMREG